MVPVRLPPTRSAVSAFFLFALAVVPTLASPASLVAQTEEVVERYPVERDSLWGYVDATGAWAIEPRFPDALPFTEGVAGVQDPESGAWGYIDADGAWVIEPRFGAEWAEFLGRSADPFSEGMAAVQLGTLQAPKLGLIDRRGAVVFEGEYEELYSPSDGLVRAQAEGRYGFLDTSGAWVLEPTYEDAGDFSEGVAPVRREFGDDYGYIDPTGAWVIEPAYGEAGPFEDGRAAVRIDFDESYIDADGGIAVPGPFDDTAPFREGLAPAKPDGMQSWVFIEPDGEVAIDGVEGRPICFALGFHNGLARVRVAAEGRTCGSVFFQGERPFPLMVEAESTQAAYIDREGAPIYMQPLDEILAEETRQDSIRAARDEAEEAAEETEARAKADRLASCPDQAIYGDPELPNWIEWGSDGKSVRFYFENAVVRVEGEREYDVTPPALRPVGGMAGVGEVLFRTIRIEPDVFEPSRLEAVVNGFGVSPVFCVPVPEAVLDDSESAGSAEILDRPQEGDDRFAADVRITSSERPDDYLAAHFETSQVVMPTADVAELESYGTWGDRKMASVEFVYDPAAEALSYSYAYETDGGGEASTSGYIGDFDGTTGLYRRIDRQPSVGEESEVVIHDVKAFGAEMVEIDVYRVPLEPPTEEEQRSFFESAEPDPESYGPDDGEKVMTLRSNRLSVEASVAPVVYAEDGSIVDEGEPVRPASLDPDGFDAGGAPQLTGVRPYDLSYQVGVPGAPGVNFEARAEPTDGGYTLTVVHAGIETSPEVAEAAQLYGVFMAGMESGEVVAMRDTLVVTLDALEIEYDPAAFEEAASVDALSMAVYGIAMENYSEAVLAAAEEVMEGGGEQEPFPVTVAVDGETGLPLRSERTLGAWAGGTEVTVEYEDGRAVITAENEAQGSQVESFPLPAGTLDLFQMHHALAFLPLGEGFTASIPLFDVSASLLREADYSSVSGGTASSAVKLAPAYSRASVVVEGMETVQTETGAVEAWRLRVTLEGSPLQLPGVQPAWREGQEWPVEATYWLSTDVPHVLLRAEYPGGVELITGG